MDFSSAAGIASSLVSILVVSVFIHFGAKSVTRDAGFLRAVFVAVVGSVFAGIIWIALGGTLGLILAVGAWGLVAAVTYRTSWFGGMAIGFVAWLLWLAVSLVFAWLL